MTTFLVVSIVLLFAAFLLFIIVCLVKDFDR